MAQPAVKQEHRPANDSDYAQAPESGEIAKDASDASEPQFRSSADNLIKRTIEEFKDLIEEMDDLKELLRAHGIPLRTTRMIVELGVQNKPDKQAILIDAALEQAEKTLGSGGCLEREALENYISTIVNLDRDLTHARSVARKEGLNSHSLGILTQMVQQNPGDGGAKAINTFLAYALAFGVKTDQLADIAGDLTQRQASVLPQTSRTANVAGQRRGKKMLLDLFVGLMIGITVIWALL